MKGSFARTVRRVVVDDASAVSSVWLIPAEHRGDVFLLAHGAGNDMHHPFVSHMHEALAEGGVVSIKFNFPYKEAGRKAPDRAPLLQQTWRAMVAAVRNNGAFTPRRIFAAGKSMGGRMASMVAAEGERFDGLLFLGYPLHPANKPERLRADHLRDVRCPMLFIQGSRDALCDLSLLQPVLERLGDRATLHVIEGGDHSFKLLKRYGRDQQDVWQEIVDTMLGWLSGK